MHTDRPLQWVHSIRTVVNARRSLLEAQGNARFNGSTV
jgi:hypothetical protein